jgi:hypothetical protein
VTRQCVLIDTADRHDLRQFVHCASSPRHEPEAQPEFDAWVVADYDLARAERTVATVAEGLRLRALWDRRRRPPHERDAP